jgi:hypothetical protein
MSDYNPSRLSRLSCLAARRQKALLLLINTELASAAAPITLVMNWNPESK